MNRLLAAALLLAPVAAHAQPSAIAPQSSSAIEASHTFCVGPCKAYTASLTSGASAGFWMVFDATTVPPDGALGVAPKYCWPWPANTGTGYAWPVGVQFVQGMTMVFSTGADCLHKTGSATAFFTVQIDG